jgi:nitrate reductase gamma subunit
MYEFVSGPLVWISFGIFFIGLLVRVISYIKGLDWQKDRVAYSAAGITGALKSVFYWIIPFASQGWKDNPVFTIGTFVFHICLLVIPIFLLGHNILWEESWGISWWTISDRTADWMTLLFFAAVIFLILRRITNPNVRLVTTFYDYVILAIAAAPFVTGYMAYHQWLHYKTILIIHILCGELMLIAIPFTKLSHIVLFFCSRAQLGMDFGIKRGGQKGRGICW